MPRPAKEKEPKVTKREKAQAEVGLKKGDKEELTRSERILLLSQSINKQYNGKAIVREGKEISNTFILRRPTGITSLDIALGGGFPAGGLSQVIGKDSSGKSYLVNKVIAHVQ